MRESNWLPGTYEYLTVIHEIGHALSLAHAHDGHEMPDAQDDIRYTIMSYNNHDSQITHWMDGKLVHHGAYTPMTYDIQTAHIYTARTRQQKLRQQHTPLIHLCRAFRRFMIQVVLMRLT